MTETVVIVHPLVEAEDRYGNTGPDWVSVRRTTVTSCRLSPNPEGEARGEGRPGIVTGHTLYLPPGSTIVAADRVEARGATWEVDGDPAVWANGTVANLRKVDG